MNTDRPQSFQIAMTNCCAVAVALFGGYFLAAYAINEMGTRMFGMHSNMPLTQQFAGYALVVPFLLQLVIKRSPFILYIYRRLFHLYSLIKYSRQSIKHDLYHRRT